MRPAEIIKKLFVKSNVTASSELDDKIMNATLAAFEKSKKISAKQQPNTWRIIIKSSIIKFAAAVVVVCAFYTKYWFAHLIWRQYMQ